MLGTFRKILERHGWTVPRSTIVVGVSGGVDSMVLVYLLRKLSEEVGFEIIAAHLNHGLRGEEADRDERFVRETMEKWDIPLERGHEKVQKIARKEGLSIQVAARKARYRFFDRVMEKHSGTWLALGHNADDVAETVLMRFLRGTSVQGLGGIPVQNGWIIRPLLPFTRKEILSYAERNGILFVEDSSNKKDIYLRNRVRHTLIPVIEREFQPSFSRHLLRYARYFDEIQAALLEMCQEKRDTLLDSEGRIMVERFGRLPVAVQRTFLESIAFEGGWLEEPLTFEQLEAILNLIGVTAGTRRLRIRKNLWAVREYDRLYFTDSLGGEAIRYVECPVPGIVEIKEIENRLSVEEVGLKGKGVPRATSQEAYVSGDRIRDRIWVRGFLPGDRLLTEQGEVKVKKLFIDTKVPLMRRPGIPIIGVDQEIIWVAGLRVGRQHHVTNTERRILRLRFQHPIKVR